MKQNLLTGFLLLLALSSFAQQIAGLQYYDQQASDGYTLLGPLSSTDTYLINNCGKVVHKWQSNRLPANEVKLLPNGWLLRCEELENEMIEAGGGGGMVSIYDQNSEIIWEYEVNNDTLRQHHDATMLPNGNILILTWKRHSLNDAIEAGRDTTLLRDASLWSEVIIEVKPEFPEGGSIVWLWDSWDHHVQNYDPEKLNYGDVAQPGKINLNFNADSGAEDWIHANGFDYNEALDQIILSSRTFSEVWIIDHSTTTLEARGSVGGNFGKGGDLLYRWGNPVAYEAGELADQQLFNQHNPNWVTNTSFFQDGITIFNNNNTFPNGSFYSSVVIITPSIENNTYSTENSRFLPAAPEYMYTREGFLSRFISGAEVLENGHILVCSGAQGHIFELNQEKEIVWSYINPVTANGIYNRDLFLSSGENINRNTMFRAH
ncbi:MAG: aryl-sulfate sulfotransferase, partial [Cyclobacteriaceae bacterium]